MEGEKSPDKEYGGYYAKVAFWWCGIPRHSMLTRVYGRACGMRKRR